MNNLSKNFIINVGRQFGSGGKEISEKLAHRLGISFYDKELIALASKESGLCPEIFENADEKASQGVALGMRFQFISDGCIPYNNYLSNDALFKIQSDVIRGLSEEKSCLFLGRCADYILRDNLRCINLFISSPMHVRVDRIVKKCQLTPQKAEEFIEKSDKMRASYYNYYSFKKWGMASTYHFCIDSSLLGIDGTVNFLYELIQARLKNETVFK